MAVASSTPLLPTSSPIADPRTGFRATAAYTGFFEWFSRLFRGTPGNCTVTWGTGSPENVVTAPTGSVFLRTDGGANTTLYVKESNTDDTGWVGK